MCPDTPGLRAPTASHTPSASSTQTTADTGRATRRRAAPPRFGVRTKGLVRPRQPSITAQALCTDSAAENGRNSGNVSSIRKIPRHPSRFTHAVPYTAISAISVSCIGRLASPIANRSPGGPAAPATTSTGASAATATTAAKSPPPHRCAVAWSLTTNRSSRRHTSPSSLRATWAPPFIHRNCWVRIAAMSAGTSLGTATSSAYRSSHPASRARIARSRSSVSVSPSQPPASSMQRRRHTPAVPLKPNTRSPRSRAGCSTAKCASRCRDSSRVKSDSSPFSQLHRPWTSPTPSSNRGTIRRRKSGSGRKSASKMATHSPRARVSPWARAPALKPSRLGRRMCSMATPSSADNADIAACTRAGVSSVESSSTWISNRSRGQSRAATDASSPAATSGSLNSGS